jgi:hypothetical protein
MLRVVTFRQNALGTRICKDGLTNGMTDFVRLSRARGDMKLCQTGDQRSTTIRLIQ